MKFFWTRTRGDEQDEMTAEIAGVTVTDGGDTAWYSGSTCTFARSVTVSASSIKAVLQADGRVAS